MHHPFMNAIAYGLAERRIATLRYQFPYMENGRKVPDRPAVTEKTVRAAVATAAQLAPGLPLFAGGKSFGGRMTSQAQAEMPFPVCRGFSSSASRCIPRNIASAKRAAHLSQVMCRCCSFKAHATRWPRSGNYCAARSGLWAGSRR